MYLYKPAFDLTDVYGGIQALANVKHNVRAKNLKIISNQILNWKHGGYLNQNV